MKVLSQKQILVMRRACIETEKLRGNVIFIKYQCETNHHSYQWFIWRFMKL